MEVRIIGSTNNFKSKEEFLNYARDAARVCYSKKDFGDIVNEKEKETLIEDTLRRGHQSLFDQGQLTFYLNGLSKMFAMVFNNEKYLVTSEKSARYTQMQTEGEQKRLYDKWMNIFGTQIQRTYPALDTKQAGKSQKLAQENARYMTSVFTPTKMVHTVSFRQLNYLMRFFNNFIKEEPDNSFTVRLKGEMNDFNQQLSYLYEPRLDPGMKRRRLSLFATRKNFQEQFGEVYSTNYKTSFACLAQLHRHRTLDYEMQPVTGTNFEFFVPPIIEKDTKLVKEWFSDIGSIASEFPQGIMLNIHEMGSHTDFISKMNERLCGNAQWEIMNRTRITLDDYLRNTKVTNPEVHKALLQYANGPKCTFPDAKCTEPCPFGSKLGIERLV